MLQLCNDMLQKQWLHTCIYCSLLNRSI